MEIGSIIIPKGFNNREEEIINLCFNEERFFVMTNTRGILDNVACLHQVLSDIEFPKDSDSLGSQVVLQEVEEASQWIIVGTLSKIGISTYNSEESLLCKKTYKGTNNEAFGNTVGMIGNTLTSKLSVFCKNVSKKVAYLLLECFGNEESKLELRSSGWVFCKGEKGIKLRYKMEKEISIVEDRIEIFVSKNQKLILKEKELFYEDGTNKFIIDKEGYKLGSINFEKYITKILDFLGDDLILLTSMGPTSPGAMASSAGPKLNELKKELANINKK